MNKKNEEKKAGLKKSKPVSFLGNGMESRISATCNIIGTRKKAAESADITTDQLARYLRGENQPRLLSMAKLCLAAGVNLQWLATGEGPMQLDTPVPVAQGPAPIDKDLLEDVIAGIEAALADRKASMPADKKARLILAVYEMYQDSGKKPTRENVIQLVRVAS